MTGITKPVAEITRDDVVDMRIRGDRQTAYMVTKVLRPRWLAKERAKDRKELSH